MSEITNAEKMLDQMGLIDMSPASIDQRHAFMDRVENPQDQQIAWALTFEIVSVLQQYGPENPILVGDLAVVLSALILSRRELIHENLRKAAERAGLDPDTIPLSVEVMGMDVPDRPIGQFDA